MQTFKDSQGADWSVSVTYDSVRRVKAMLGVNLFEVEQGDPPLATRLQQDLCLFCDVLYCLCKPEADARNLTDEDFGRGLGGDAILRAGEAFGREYADFFRGLGQTAKAKATEKARHILTLGMRLAEQRIDAYDAEAELSKALSGSPGNSPGSPASTPAP